MPKVRVLLFGLNGEAAGKTQMTQSAKSGTTVEDLWLQLQGTELPNGRIAAVNRAVLLVLVNGQPIDYLEGWKTKLHHKDQITYMRRTVGG
jgi:molybdopterin converting factor small subunit